MLVEKNQNIWNVVIETKDNQLGLINIIRHLDAVNQEINDKPVEGLLLELDLNALISANSELIAEFVIIQTNLVRSNGRLKIVNANPELKSTFDVVMLDKIISIQYVGMDEENNSYDEDDDYSEE